MSGLNSMLNWVKEVRMKVLKLRNNKLGNVFLTLLALAAAGRAHSRVGDPVRPKGWKED